MSNEDLFRLVYDGMQQHYETFVSDVTTTIAAVMIAIGWVVTSEKCREFLAGNRFAHRISLAAVGLTSLCAIVPYLVSYFAARADKNLLDKLNVAKQAYYECFVIHWWHLAANIALTLLMFGLLGLLIWRLPNKSRLAG